jgi:hypothetical protein
VHEVTVAALMARATLSRKSFYVAEVAAEKIKRATSEGTGSGLDPLPTARALVGMNVAYFFSELVARPDADVSAVVETLAAIGNGRSTPGLSRMTGAG